MRPASRVEQLEGRGGALDRGTADLVGMGEGRGFAGHAAQAESGTGVIIGGLQPPVVEAERLAGAVLKIELAVIASGQVPGGERPRLIRIERSIKEAARVGGHAALRSAGPPSSTKRRSQ
jgi:hypothetical protein